MYVIAEYLTYLALVGVLGLILFLGALLAMVTREGADRIVENSARIARTASEMPRRLDPGKLFHRHPTEHTR